MNDFQTDSLQKWLLAELDLTDPPAVGLVRAYTNDVYRVETSHQRFALKIYGAGWRTDSAIRWELDLLRHLSAGGARVALPAAVRDGEDPLRYVEIDGCQRQAVLFEWAVGEKPSPPFTPAQYRRQGMATARLHQAADGFSSPYARAMLELDTLVDAPLATIEAIPGNLQAKAELQTIASALRATIDALVQTGLDWGPCHGDLTFDNVHVTDADETIWYDFDSGGPGWRAIDLQGWAATLPDREADWQAFLAGYQSVRPLSANDITAAPYLFLAQELWSIQVDLERRVLVQGPAAVSRFLIERARSLSHQARMIGLLPQS